MKKCIKACVLLILCMLLSVLWAGCAAKTGETFRNAKVVAVAGGAVLLREDVSMELYEGLLLRSGDQITVASDGRVDLKLDEDKYVVLDANTVVGLELAGDPQKGAIRLNQTAGTIHHSIENPLSENDSYEVHTPDAVMAVRGTEFDTTVTGTEEGSRTQTDVQDGEVEMTPNNSSEPPRSLGPGESAAAGTEGGGDSQFLVPCPVCTGMGMTLEEHLLSCGEGHYSCDGSSHGELPCGHNACTAGDHESLLACGGHYACSEGDHETQLTCGHYVCEEGDHESTYTCGHNTCQGGSHEQMECGHFACAEGDHETQLTCGHYACYGGNHSTMPCGHRACSSGNHGIRDCGHYGCTGGDHSRLSCGGYACESGHGAMACGHCRCDQTSEDHSQMPCGHYGCNTEDLGHERLSCGSYDCRGNGHRRCYGCGSCVCTGDHSELACGHLVCEGGSHGSLACGHFSCSGGSHELLACGHYDCAGGVHDAYLSCGELMCKEGHSSCLWCGQCICTGTHGEGVCNVTG